MPANPIFDAVQAGAATLDSSLVIESQDDEKIVFKGEYGHCTVFSNGTVESRVPGYATGMNAIIAGQEPPVKAKNGRSPGEQVNTSIAPRRSNGGQMAASGGQVRDVQVADLCMDDIKEHICPAATDQEAFMFLKLCQARNLNPFTGEAYLVKYGTGKANMIVGKEAFTRKAEQNPQFDGMEAGIIIKSSDNGPEFERAGSFVRHGEVLIGGWARVYRKDRKIPFYSEVSLGDYRRPSQSGKTPWDTMPAVMIRKVALVSALREAFACDLSGMYDSSEMAQAGIDPEKEISL
jgi:phage recombination protein Bet